MVVCDVVWLLVSGGDDIVAVVVKGRITQTRTLFGIGSVKQMNAVPADAPGYNVEAFGSHEALAWFWLKIRKQSCMPGCLKYILLEWDHSVNKRSTLSFPIDADSHTFNLIVP